MYRKYAASLLKLITETEALTRKANKHFNKMKFNLQNYE